MAGLYSAPTLSTLKVEQFKGLDCSVPEDQMKPYRAAKSENMIPGAVGEVKKRPGVHFKKTVSTPGRDTDKIVEMVGGLHPIYYHSIQIPGYSICYNTGSNVITIATVQDKPTVIPCNGGWIVFATCRDWGDYDYGMVGGKANIDYGFFGAMILIGFGNGVLVYTDQGKRYEFNNNKWECSDIQPDDEFLTVPTIVHNANPAGGGSVYQQINLLSPWVTESFHCTGTGNNTFYLLDHAMEGDGSERVSDVNRLTKNFRVEVLCAIDKKDDGNGHDQTITRWIKRQWVCSGDKWDGYRPGSNRLFLYPGGNGEVPYTDDDGKTYNVKIGTGDAYDGGGNYIGATPIEGEDNVRITHRRANFGEEFRKLCACVCGTVYGVGGYKDRLFIAGGEGQYGYYKDRIYYSELEDPFYIGALNYIKLDGNCKVMALDGTADTLAALTDQGVYLIQASVQDNSGEIGYISDAVFTVSGRVRAPAPLNYGNTAVLGGEIVYLSKEGVIAIAYKENFDERFAEHRSAMIDREMLADGPQQLLSLGRFLMIRCAGGVWWLLDENQPNSEGDKPYSSHQYEGYRLTGMPADAAWVVDDQLMLIKGNAQYCWTDGTSGDHYYDEYDGVVAAINAWWETPWLYGSNFYRNKIFTKLGLLLDRISFVSGNTTLIADSAVKVEGRKNDETDDEWKVLIDYDGTLCSFNYGNLDYRLFTYEGAPGLPMIVRKIKIKKAKRFKLRFSNDFIDQTFILRQFGLDYVQED